MKCQIGTSSLQLTVIAQLSELGLALQVLAIKAGSSKVIHLGAPLKNYLYNFKTLQNYHDECLKLAFIQISFQVKSIQWKMVLKKHAQTNNLA